MGRIGGPTLNYDTVYHVRMFADRLPRRQVAEH